MGEVTSYSDYRAGSIFQRARNPRVFFPQPGEKNVFKDSVFEVGPFASLYGDLERAYRVFEIREAQQRWGDAFFRYEADQDNLDLVEHGLDEVIEFAKSYVFRVRDVLTDGTSSDWTEISFSTYVAHTLAPELIGPKDEDEVDTSQPYLETKSMEVSAGSDPHVGSHFRVYRAGDDELIYDSGEIGAETEHYMSSSNFIGKYQLERERQYYWQARHQSERWGWSDWSEKAYFVTTQPETPRQATADGADLGTGDYLEFDPYEGDGEHIKTEVEIRQASDQQAIYEGSKETGELTVYSLPVDELDPETDYQWRVRYESDTWGYSDWTSWRTFTTPSVATPTLQEPYSGRTYATRQGVELQASEHSVSHANPVLKKVEWEIYKNGGSTPVWENESSSESTTFPAENLEPDTTYQWRVKYTDEYWGESAWSDTREFSTVYTYTPSVETADGSELGTGDHFKFSDYENEDEHVETKVEIRRQGGSVVYTGTKSSGDLTRYELPAGELDQDTDYEVRIQYKGSDWGESDFSSWVGFHTPSISTPSRVSPADGKIYEVRENVELESSSYAISSGEANFDEAIFEIYKEGESEPEWTKTETKKTTVVPSEDLDKDTTYQWRVKHTDDYWGESAWSDYYSFETVETPVPDPETEGEQLGTGDYLHTSDYPNDDAHLQTQIEIRRKSDQTMVYTGTKSSGDLTRYELPADELDAETNYQWRARFEGDSWGWSDWSDWTDFHTAKTQTPEANSPSGGERIGIGDELVGSTFSVSKGETNFDQANFRIYEVGGTNPIWSESVSSTSVTIPTDQLDSDTDYEWSVQYVDDYWGESEFSDRSSFVTAYVEQPSITSHSNGDTIDSSSSSRTIATSSFSVTTGSDTHTHTEWHLVDKTTDTTIWSDTSSSHLTSRMIDMSDLEEDHEYEVRARHIGETWGESAWSATVTLYTPELATPSADSPSGGTEIGIGDELDASSLSVSGDSSDYVESEFEIDGVWSTTTSSTSVTIPTDELSADSSYQWRVRHRDANWGWTSWSSYSSFTTAETATPSITSPDDGETVSSSSSDRTITTSSITATTGGESHSQSQWYLYDVTDGSTIWDNVTSSSDLTSRTVSMNDLEPDHTYEAQVRHQGETWGWSSWSSKITFNTPSVATPSANSPSGGSEIGDGDNLQSSSLSVNGDSPDHDASEWEIFIDGNSSALWDDTTGASTSRTIPISELDEGTDYEWRVRLRDANWGWSDWSSRSSFTTAYIETPTNQSPTDGTTISSDSSDRTLSASSFSVSSGSDTHAESQWYLQNSTTGEVLWENVSSSSDLTSRTVDMSELEGDCTYEWQVRYRGSTWGWSDWSSKSTFSTPKVEQPTNETPSDGEEGFEGGDIELEVEDLELVGDSLEPEEIEWELYNKDTGEKVWSKTEEF